jgi:hypothetical protein
MMVALPTHQIILDAVATEIPTRSLRLGTRNESNSLTKLIDQLIMSQPVIADEGVMPLNAFKPGDRVELVRYCSLSGEPSPQGTVVSMGYRLVRCKMDRTGRVIGFPPDDLRHVEPQRGVRSSNMS